MAALPIQPWHLAPRIAAGAMVLHSGLAKHDAEPEAAAGVHGMAATAYPFLGDVDPALFTKVLSAGEIALGTALLAPVVPSAVAGAALTAFGAGLLGLYARVPGLRRPGSVRPTQDGTGIAKDVWLVGIGLGLVTEALLRRDRD